MIVRKLFAALNCFRHHFDATAYAIQIHVHLATRKDDKPYQQQRRLQQRHDS